MALRYGEYAVIIYILILENMIDTLGRKLRVLVVGDTLYGIAHILLHLLRNLHTVIGL